MLTFYSPVGDLASHLQGVTGFGIDEEGKPFFAPGEDIEPSEQATATLDLQTGDLILEPVG
jgi:hypothetical protein